MWTAGFKTYVAEILLSLILPSKTENGSFSFRIPNYAEEEIDLSHFGHAPLSLPCQGGEQGEVSSLMWYLSSIKINFGELKCSESKEVF